MTQKTRQRHRVELYKKNPVCHYCGRLMRPDGNLQHSATIEHVIPLGEGGSDTADNMVLAHRSCNQIENWLHQTEANLRGKEEL